MGIIAKALTSRRMLCVFLYGISSGLPLLLIGATLKAWMKDQQVDLTIIGAYALTGLPYTLKFLWAPLMDRYVPPFLGRRRGWIAICQILIAIGLFLMSAINPAEEPWLLGAICLFLAFVSASQDIVIDAYRREILADGELGLGSSMGVNGYRIGMLIAGALALALADHIPWSSVYLSMSGVMLIGFVVNFFAPEPVIGKALPPKNLRDAIVLPFVDFMKRSHAVEILLFILLFKIGDSMASDMFNPFYLDLGFSKTEVAAIAKLFGFWATIGGGLLGGLAMVRLGIIRSLWIFGFLQMFSTAGFCLLATMGHQLGILTAVVIIENVCTAMATSAYVGFMASLCNKRFTATQYALLSSLMGVPRVIFGSSSGYLAKNMGWTGYFLFCVVLHIPGLLMLLRNKKWMIGSGESEGA
jgi:MFS transporter, PAT family, beta-lactamase induction signal transducer AmpG